LYFHVVTINGKRRGRRGKPLVAKAYIADTDDRNQEFRCQVLREQPFRSTTTDVSQATERCNVDFQFLACAPRDGAAADLPIESAPASSGAPQPAVQLRLREKTSVTRSVRKPAFIKRPQRPAWFPGIFRALSAKERACVVSFAAAFRKAAAMDFYTTKYQGKPMESMTPLFQCMTDGVIRLERQEQVEQAEAESSRMALAEETDGGPPRKQRKTREGIIRLVRRLTIRLASLGSRCFWVSAAELTAHILTDGDCLQSHNNITLFTRQLQ